MGQADHDDEQVKDEVTKYFGWTRLESEHREYFAKDARGERLWLKSRNETDKSRGDSWDWKGEDPEFDALIGIICAMDGEWKFIIRAPREAVQDLKHPDNEGHRLRWSDRNTRLDPRIVILYARKPFPPDEQEKYRQRLEEHRSGQQADY